MANKMTFQTCFVNTEDVPVRVEHVCYYTRDDGDNGITLHEVIQEFYKHPQAPNDALIPLITTRRVTSCNRLSERASPLVVLEAMQKTVKSMEHLIR